jgi:hypothetical protein
VLLALMGLAAYSALTVRSRASRALTDFQYVQRHLSSAATKSCQRELDLGAVFMSSCRLEVDAFTLSDSGQHRGKLFTPGLWHGDAHALTECLGRRPAVQVFCRRVPTRDGAVEVDRDDCFLTRFNDGGEQPSGRSRLSSVVPRRAIRIHFELSRFHRLATGKPYQLQCETPDQFLGRRSIWQD